MTSLHSRLLAALLLAGLSNTAARAQEPASPEQIFPQLEAFLRQAATQSPRMISRSLDLEIADATRDAYRAGMYPSVSGSYRILETRDERQDQVDPFDARKIYYDLSLTQPVYHWGAIRNNARIGDIQKRIAEGNYREAYRLFAQEIRSLYLQLIVKKGQVGRAQFNLQHMRELLKVAEERIRERAISEGALALARTNVEQAELALDRAIEDFDGTRGAFGRMTGMQRPLEADEIPDQIPVLNLPEGSFASPLNAVLGKAEVPTIETLRYQEQINQEVLYYKMHRVRLLPKLNFTMGASQDEQSFTINTSNRYRLDSLYVGLHVNWHIFDGFAARSAVRSSLARRRQLETDLRAYTENTKASLQSQLRQLGFAARSMAIADRNVTGIEGLLAARIQDQRTGQASESDVRVSELAVLDAKISANAARLDFLIRAGELRGLLVGDPALANLPQE